MHPFHYCDVTVYGFHGCNAEIKRQILSGALKFENSANRYDWLGTGVYFWENDFLRAHEWAVEAHGKKTQLLSGPGSTLVIVLTYLTRSQKIFFGCRTEICVHNGKNQTHLLYGTGLTQKEKVILTT